jgi:hypothetical protein
VSRTQADTIVCLSRTAPFTFICRSIATQHQGHDRLFSCIGAFCKSSGPLLDLLNYAETEMISAGVGVARGIVCVCGGNCEPGAASSEFIACPADHQRF